MERIKNILEFDGLFTVPSDGRGGGLALMWKGRDMVWVDSFSKYHIDAIVNGGLESAWRLTGFYGEPDNNHQSEGWDMLRMLSSKQKLPWCCFGDFNELLEVSDKRDGVPRAHSQMQMFREVLDHCGFVDLGYSGPDFTWHGWRRGELIWERLDRGVANYDWVSRFPAARIQHFHCYTLDHRPILLSLNGNGEKQRWRRKPFRFESMWVANPGCKVVINEAWAEPVVGNPMFTTTTKMKKCKMKLKKWSRESFGSIKNRIKEARERLWVAEETSA